jgi:hypothetical protein
VVIVAKKLRTAKALASFDPVDVDAAAGDGVADVEDDTSLVVVVPIDHGTSHTNKVQFCKDL